MADVGYAASVLEMNQVEATARKLGLEVDKLEIRRAEDIVAAAASSGVSKSAKVVLASLAAYRSQRSVGPIMNPTIPCSTGVHSNLDPRDG